MKQANTPSKLLHNTIHVPAYTLQHKRTLQLHAHSRSALPYIQARTPKHKPPADQCPPTSCSLELNTP
jgi:hypothetical protein